MQILFDACQHKEVGDHNVMKCQRIFFLCLFLSVWHSFWLVLNPHLVAHYAQPSFFVGI